jgi:hypothetical protein
LAPGHPYLTRLWAKRIDSALGQQGAESQLGEFCTLGLMWEGLRRKGSPTHGSAAPRTMSRVSQLLAVTMPKKTRGYPTTSPWLSTTKLCAPTGKAVAILKRRPKKKELT